MITRGGGGAKGPYLQGNATFVATVFTAVVGSGSLTFCCPIASDSL